MSLFKPFQRVSRAPTNPRPAEPAPHAFDVASLYEDPLGAGKAASTDATPLDEKLRQAYFWIVNSAIISPHYDIEYNEGPPQQYVVGDHKRPLTLPSAQSYSSYVLLPLLTFATRRKCLLVGGPGRGKTASAILMGVLAGYPLREVRRAMQHGHPQMTIADLLGNPLPADLVSAQSMDAIRIAWRSWLSMRVKIIDEYNRIPTRTQSALLTVMGVLAGYPLREVRRAMQHGHPQMTIADLLGNPLPADLVSAQSMDAIRIAWRSWLSMRVKIIDEYNRIPTRTQSALLTVMGDNYAEVLNHIFECPDSAWYLTANDDRGGGTYQVIEALRDRIDVVVPALAFNPRFLDQLLSRIEQNLRPEELVPQEIVFTQGEVDRLGDQVRAIDLPVPVRRRLEFFASQFELMESAGAQFETMTKDVARLSGVEWSEITAGDDGRDRLKDLGCQTRNGLSVRNLMTLMVYAKALAFFRGNPAVDLDDLRQVLPFVLQDKLHPDPEAPFFALPENGAYRTDRLGWLRRLFDLSCEEYDRLDLDRDDPVGDLGAEFDRGLDDVSEREVRARMVRIEQFVGERVRGRKLYGHLYDDLLKLKYLHQRYTNYLHWLRAQ